MNVLLRTIFDKPEMLYLSLKYERLARVYFDDDYLTIFAVDYGANPKCLEIIKEYPFKHAIIKRPYRHYVCANVMEGLKTACQYASDFVINMEDDIILHKTYFEFIRKAHNLLKFVDYSAITMWGYSPFGDPSILRKTDYFCGPGVLINKTFFDGCVAPYAISDYYRNREFTIHNINKLNENNPKAKYSINNLAQHDWDGLVNRLIDYFAFNNDLHSYSSLCFRLLHIGFYGFNRHGRYPNHIQSFEDKVKFLESHIFDPGTLSALDGTYKDYQTFDPRLDTWDGSLSLEA